MAGALAPVAHYEIASPSLLAATPAIAPSYDHDMSDRDWQSLRVQLEQRAYALRQTRISWWQHWGMIADALLPRRYQWLLAPNTNQRGLAINQAIKDPTGSQALRICTAGMRSGLMSSSRPWFTLTTGPGDPEPDHDGRAWMDTVQDELYSIMAGSNFYQAGTQMFEDLTAFGTAPKIIYEDAQDLIRCIVPSCGEYFLGAGQDFRVNSLYRIFNLTLLQIVEMFGLKNIGTELQSYWSGKGPLLDTEFTIAHAIEPNFPVGRFGENPRLGVVPGPFAFREYYWLWARSTEKPLSVRGFRSKPFIAPRWATSANDAYGRSPGMDALPDILQLHRMTDRQAEAIDKIVRPPMMADASMKNQPSSILPGRITYVADLAKGMKPIYEVRPDISAMSALIEKIEKRVERWFYVDLFQMLENMEGVQPRNELEINERRGEKLQVLGPVVENVEQELAGGVRRIYAIADRRGRIPAKPPSLQNVQMRIDIRSMIALAQEAAQTATMERTMQVGAQMAPLFPGRNPLDNVDPDLFFREYAKRTAFPAKIMISSTQVAQTREQQQKAAAQAQQKQEAMAAATHAAPAAASALKDVSQTEVGGGLNAIQMLSGMGGAADGITGLAQ